MDNVELMQSDFMRVYIVLIYQLATDKEFMNGINNAPQLWQAPVHTHPV